MESPEQATPNDAAAIDWAAALARLHAVGLELAEDLLEDDERRVSPWAMSCAHLAMHAAVAECRSCAVSLAIQEIVLNRGQASTAEPLLKFATELERAHELLHDALIALGAPFPDVVAYSVHHHVKHERPECGRTPHAHEELCIAPTKAMRSLVQTLRLFRSTATGLRAGFATLEHRLPATPETDRLWLLMAVAQHLNHGGFSHRENAALAPDQPSSRAPNKQDIERVRKRCSAEDARTFKPMAAPKNPGRNRLRRVDSISRSRSG